MQSLLKESPGPISDWNFVRRLGQGGFGTVSLWEHGTTHQKIAIKTAEFKNCAPSSIEKQTDRWIQEIDLLAKKITNNHIVAFIDVGQNIEEIFRQESPSRLPVLIMEYCEGGDLRTCLNNENNCNGLKESLIRSVLESLRSSISYLHSIKITHRDIKPENIVCTVKNGRPIYKLTDLGYARLLDSCSIAASLVGTLEYVAPEVLRDQKYTNSVDYWSMGIIAFEICCGCRPFLSHETFFRKIQQIAKKRSNHIAIVEDNDGKVTLLSEMFPENHLSSCMQKYLEKWLTYALEYSPKQRGYSMELPSKNDVDGLAPDRSIGPQMVLRIFTLLDEILAKTIIKVFCLYSFQCLSYEINDSMTMQSLINKISQETGIPNNELHLIYPLDKFIHLDRLGDTIRPIDFYDPDIIDQPMLFVCRIGHGLKDNIEPNIPEIIKSTMANPKLTMKTHVVKYFAKSVYYFIQNEQTKYLYFLEGIKNFTWILNHFLLTFKSEVRKMIQTVYGLSGFIKVFKELLVDAEKKLNDYVDQTVKKTALPLWKENLGKLDEQVVKLSYACDRIDSRYQSAARRNLEHCKHAILDSSNFSGLDIYNMTGVKKRYIEFRYMCQEKKLPAEAHKGLFKCCIECFKERDKLLYGDRELSEILKEASQIKEEYAKIRETVFMTVEEAKKLEKQLKSALVDHQSNMWNLNEIRSSTTLNDTNNLPDMEQIMDSIHFNIGEPVSSGKSITESAASIAADESLNGEVTDLIVDHENLLVSLSNLWGDKNAVVKRKSN